MPKGKYLRIAPLYIFRLPLFGKSKWPLTIRYLRKPGGSGYSEVCGLLQLAFSTTEKRVSDVFRGTCRRADAHKLTHMSRSS